MLMQEGGLSMSKFEELDASATTKAGAILGETVLGASKLARTACTCHDPYCEFLK